jgi:hypothetical protein
MMHTLRSTARFFVSVLIALVIVNGGAVAAWADTIKIKATAKGPAYDLQQAAKRGEIPESLRKDEAGKPIDVRDYTSSLVNARGEKVTPETVREQPKGEYTLDTTAARDPFATFAKGEIAHYGPVKGKKGQMAKRSGKGGASAKKPSAKPTDTRGQQIAATPVRGKWATTAVGGRVTVFPSLGAVRQPGETANYAITAKNAKGEEITDLKLGEVKGNSSSISESAYANGVVTLDAGNPGTATIQVVSESDPSISFVLTLVVTHPEIYLLESDSVPELSFAVGSDPAKISFTAYTPSKAVIETPLVTTGYDPKVVKVIREGMVVTVQPLAVGTTTVTVKPQLVQGDDEKITVTVAEKVVEKVAFDKTDLTIKPGETAQLVAAVYYTDQTTSAKFSKPVSSDETVVKAELREGKVVLTPTGKPGTAEVTLTSSENPNVEPAKATVTVPKPEDAAPAKPQAPAAGANAPEQKPSEQQASNTNAPAVTNAAAPNANTTSANTNKPVVGANAQMSSDSASAAVFWTGGLLTFLIVMLVLAAVGIFFAGGTLRVIIIGIAAFLVIIALFGRYMTWL